MNFQHGKAYLPTTKYLTCCRLKKLKRSMQSESGCIASFQLMSKHHHLSRGAETGGGALPLPAFHLERAIRPPFHRRPMILIRRIIFPVAGLAGTRTDPSILTMAFVLMNSLRWNSSVAPAEPPCWIRNSSMIP